MLITGRRLRAFFVGGVLRQRVPWRRERVFLPSGEGAHSAARYLRGVSIAAFCPDLSVAGLAATAKDNLLRRHIVNRAKLSLVHLPFNSVYLNKSRGRIENRNVGAHCMVETRFTHLGSPRCFSRMVSQTFVFPLSNTLVLLAK